MNNNEGFTLIFVLMILVTLSIIGFYSIQDSVTEGNISRNISIYNMNLYAADTSGRRLSQVMEDDTSPGINLKSNVAGHAAYLYNLFDFSTAPDWAGGLLTSYYFDSSGTIQACSSSVVTDHQFLAEYNGVAPGSNLDVTEPTRLYSYTIYSRGISGNSSVVTEMNYWRRF